jgi:hypothetical protein
MINHARTLLLNVAGERIDQVDVPGDVYIPSFNARDYGEPITTVQRILFGADPDYEGRIFRMDQYMRLLQSNEFQAYVFDLDPRVTYDLTKDAFAGVNYIVTGRGDSRLVLSGTWADAGVSGRVNTSWRILATGTNTVRTTNINDNVTSTETITDGTLYTLPGSTLKYSFTGLPLENGDRWDVFSKDRPQPDLSAILTQLKSLPRGTADFIFGSDKRQEPFRTFERLYKEHYALPYQLGGFLLGLIYRMEAIRNGA